MRYTLRVDADNLPRQLVRSNLTKAELRVWLESTMKDEHTIRFFVEKC